MSTSSEVESYIEKFRELRAELLKQLESLPAEALNWKPAAPDTNSVYVIATHLLGSEKFWIHQIIGGIDIQRQRDAEFVARGDDASVLRAELDAIATRSESILRNLSNAELDALRSTNPHYGNRSTRWCILHTHEHYARHLGHIELTRQLWENSQMVK